MIIPSDRLDALLARVTKPARYAGGEWNSIAQDWSQAQVTLALAFPDTYEIGMSNLGLTILYDLVNRRPGLLAERVYAPWEDMAAALREADLPLYSLETRHALGDFDVIGFSLQHELNYTNLLGMLDLAGIPLLSSERDHRHPLVIAGGSCTYNPEPIAEFLDAVAIGEGEEVLLEILQAVAGWKRDTGRAAGSRADLLGRLARIPGVYVPSIYRVVADGEGTPSLEPLDDAPATVRKRILPRLGPAPTRPVVPSMRVVHDRAAVEIQRGCGRGCRFCQAGIIYRPVRARPLEETLAAVDELLRNTGYSEVGLVSLSSSDHPAIGEIVSGVGERHGADRVAVSLPSMRIDSFSVRLAEMIQSTRKTGFTFAPEAGSQRVRDVINKGVTEDDLLRTAHDVFANGWNRIKLYFMIGLPTETDEDVLEIARLVREIERLGREVRRRPVEIAVSVSTFVPKPHTPFQWAPLAPREVIQARQTLLRERIRGRNLSLSWSDWEATWLEAVMARGDRRLSAVILRAWRAGAAFDAWSERFRPEIWRQAFAEEGLAPAWYASRERPRDERLPWVHIATGVSRAYLWREYRNALEGKGSPDCYAACTGCGILGAFREERGGVPDQAWRCP